MKKQPIIIVATNEEYELAQKRFLKHKIIQTGVGGINVIKSLCDLPKDTPIINFGYAGSNKIKKGTEVKIGKSQLYHPNVTYDEPYFILLEGDIICYTSNDFVLETDIEEPCVFDMELAYILALGFTNIKSIKIISDTLNFDEYEQYVDNN